MKLTESKLKNLIKEEFRKQRVMNESIVPTESIVEQIKDIASECLKDMSISCAMQIGVVIASGVREDRDIVEIVQDVVVIPCVAPKAMCIMGKAKEKGLI